ncbi:hypothetical protein BEN47_17700 [Hymenobacter lapidarius]|uniref:Uncharacterized protein n=1 Tax=Hymenobacter lapidarius TaxID=1908237 RepID=A0A1G1SX80_9BACT|nr:hypothetical protein [Hymenobacter lapidarius]OGX83238.1 hypothetical protein BEN47_17700 [Hymenobacter lapidarius]
MSDRLSEHPTFNSVGKPKKGGDDAVALTREMTNRLRLNEGQFLSLLPLNRTKLVGLKSINREYRNDEATRAAKIAELEAQYEQECSRILTPSQLSQLQSEQPASTPTGSGNGLG